MAVDTKENTCFKILKENPLKLFLAFRKFKRLETAMEILGASKSDSDK